MYFSYVKTAVFTLVALIVVGAFGSVASASHSWGDYHWARTANPFTLKLGDNVSAIWDGHLATSSLDWSVSSVLDTTIVPGLTTAKRCRPTNGRVEVCNSTYGKNGWLGIAQIWISGSHITQGVVKMNDTYFSKAPYNTATWRQMVVCQEIGHTFGLDHQDENFSNPNLGTCMDYTSDPSTNQHPNDHDYAQLETIYAHLDSITTILTSVLRGGAIAADSGDGEDWGREVKKEKGDGKRAKESHYERNLGKGEKIHTFVIWADESAK